MAEKLAEGFNDLLVVLLEPTDIYSSCEPEEVIIRSNALQAIDNTLRDASKGQRSLANTCTFDIRPFRSASVREVESDDEKDNNDEFAYEVFQNMVHVLKPKVIIVCQCSTERVRNELAAKLSSSTGSTANLRV